MKGSENSKKAVKTLERGSRSHGISRSPKLSTSVSIKQLDFEVDISISI